MQEFKASVKEEDGETGIERFHDMHAPTHTLRHTYTREHTGTCARMFINALAHACLHAYTRTPVHSLICMHSHRHKFAPAHALPSTLGFK